ncbi:type VI secretion system Vgr family protein [Burkholderia ubonensis]|uniref:Type IV secretion protein Rhs n=1 Tax=Burkholderia ubonensis TaxID=101571 RepID=A0A119M999_9BURK|nr:type VI secretion system Vgr family protein [Burkholderia ubonensis]AOK60042.1 type IV secretion protein Rhs [Burkholderia ubonensis]KWD79942.1 type IV secretion protein Rhs [Burkholderia ubonensis]KWD81109.1 type IV secretion protein Rhs [Burkholderia ubonensis]KWD97309.1 type IV secretion protein Rhs [Burkholderia ubonensis]KWE06134.1 type IV secretion protein Rhs [Burkholderia ubonensis]
MNIRESFRNFVSGIDTNRRPVVLNWGKAQQALESKIALQHASIHESMMTGITGHLTCISQRGDLPPKLFIGAPVSVGIVTDRGRLHTINAIVSAVQIGRTDGELTVYQFTVTDAVNLLHKRTNSRIFRNVSVVDVLEVILNEWRQRSVALAQAFEFDLSQLDRSRYPSRSFVRQVNESDAHFISRLVRRDGITMFVRSGHTSGAAKDGDPPVHTLVFCDDPKKLSEGPAGTVRVHPRDAGTEQRDTITALTMRQQLISGESGRPSWDYRYARVDQSNASTRIDQGEAGNDLAKLLTDIVIDVPHMADSWTDHERMTEDRILAHEAQAVRYDGVSGIRDLAVGSWITIAGDGDWSTLPSDQQQFVITSLHHDVWNNLPKGLNERAQALFAASHMLQQPPSLSGGDPSGQDTRYENTFSCVPRGTPLTPLYDPKADLPPTPLITGRVVGADGEEVSCDENGCVFVQILGQDSADHAHAQGAGTNDNQGDSAPIRVASSLAGPNFGETFLPRVGTEVLLGSLGGDPDRLVIIGVLANGANMPASFTHTGSLPGNRYLSGIKTKEIKGQRYNQLRLDDTPQQISAQLASEHAHTQLNLGYLTQPRDNGQGGDRGEGAELRTDAAAALRAAQGMLLTTYARTQASGGQLDRDELVQLLGECAELFKALGDYAGQHGGKATDATGQQAVVTAFKGWTPGGGASGAGHAPNAGAGDSQALMAFGAKAGSVNITPKTHVTYAGENIDQIAQQHLQLVSGQRVIATAGQGVHMFGRGEGVHAIAGEGPMVLQAQQDTLSATAQKGIQIMSIGDEVLISGKSIRLVAEDGSYVKVGGGIEVGSDGAFTAHTAGHDFVGPNTDHVAPPAFNRTGADQKFRLRYPGTDGDDGTHPVPNRPYKITLRNGQVINGTSDAHGLTELASSDAMHIAHIQVFDV